MLYTKKNPHCFYHFFYYWSNNKNIFFRYPWLEVTLLNATLKNENIDLRWARSYSHLNITLNPFKPDFTIVIFIHYKPRIAVAILDL